MIIESPLYPTRILFDLDLLVDMLILHFWSPGAMHDIVPKSENVKRRTVTFHNGDAESF